MHLVKGVGARAQRFKDCHNVLGNIAGDPSVIVVQRFAQPCRSENHHMYITLQTYKRTIGSRQQVLEAIVLTECKYDCQHHTTVAAKTFARTTNSYSLGLKQRIRCSESRAWDLLKTAYTHSDAHSTLESGGFRLHERTLMP